MIDLREVAAPPWEEDLLITAQPKGVVDVWLLVHAARCATFETVWGSGGGWRGALATDQTGMGNETVWIAAINGSYFAALSVTPICSGAYHARICAAGDYVGAVDTVRLFTNTIRRGKVALA